MLKKNVIALPISTGIDAGETDPHHVERSALKMENAIVPRRGAVAKRNGTYRHSYSSSYHLGLSDYRGKPFAFQSGVANLFNGTNSAGTWKVSQSNYATLAFPELSVENLDVLEGFNNTMWMECAHNDNYVVVAYQYYYSSTNVMLYRTYHRDTMLRVQSSSSYFSFNASHQNPGRVVTTADGDIVAVYVTGNTLYIRKLGSDGTWPSASSITLSAPTIVDGAIDVIPAQYYSGDSIYVIFETAANNSVALIDVSAATETSRYSTATGYGAGTGRSICWTNNTPSTPGLQNIYAAWYDGTNVTCVTLDTSLTALYTLRQTAQANIKKVSVISSADGADGACQVYVQTQAANSRPVLYNYQYKITAGVSAWTAPAQEVIRGATIVSKPFVINGEIVFWCAHQGGQWWAASVSDIDKATTQRSLFLIGHEANTAYNTVVGKALVGFSGYNFASNPSPTLTPINMKTCSAPSRLWDVSGQSDYYFASPRYNGPQQASSSLIYVDGNMGTVDLPKCGGSISLPGASPTYFDGQQERAQSCHEWPEGVTVATNGAGGSWASTGTVGFKVVYEFIDAEGRVCQSVPSPTVSYTISATTNQPQLTIPTAQLGSVYDYGACNIVVYMTDIDGNIFYRRETIANAATSSTQTSTAYTGTGNIYTTSGDGIVAVTEPLYTTGGILEVTPARPHYVSCAYQNRLFYVDGENPRTRIYYTREIRPGRTIPHSDFLYIDCDPAGGKITGLVSLDEKLIILKETAIYAIHGEGPDDTGGSSSYSRPRRISQTIGMPTRRCSTLIPQGLMFSSSDGIYLLDRSEQLIPIGRRVKYYTDTYSVTSATTDPSRHIALFSTSDGPTIVYDHQFDSWSTWTSAYNDVKEIAYVAGNLWAVSDSSYTYVMDSSVYTDNSTGYTMGVETEWFRMDQLREFRFYKAYLLGYNPVDSKVNFKYAYNYDPTWKIGRSSDQKSNDLTSLQNFAFTDYLGSGLSSSYDDQAVIIQTKGGKQRIKAIRFAIYDSAPSGGSQGRGFEATSIVMVVGAKEQGALIGDTRKAS